MAATTTHRITIDPVTRLEGHGRIEIFLNEEGAVDRAYFQVPELRGFEKFAQGRPAEDMPQITSRICGVCPTAHHMASTKALDALYQVEPPPAGKKIRELIYCTFMVEDHALHFYFLGGPDFIVGPQAPAAERNVLGVIAKVGVETGQKVIAMRRKLRDLIALAGGKPGHPVFGLPGGVARPLSQEDRDKFRSVAAESVEFGQFSLEAFRKLVLENSDYVELIRSDAYTHRTYYMGLVDSQNRLNFYDGLIRVVDPDGRPFTSFTAAQYADYIAERVEPWSYMKFCYLKPVGWHGFTDGPQSGVYAVAPLARLNAAERMKELAEDPEITDPNIRTIPRATPREGIGVVEAPRGTLIHHYATDERGIIQKANMIVATQNNAARISLSVEKAARSLVSGKDVSEGLLNMVEMSFRAYDPCLGCATHSLPGSMPLWVEVRSHRGERVALLRRDSDGSIHRE